VDVVGGEVWEKMRNEVSRLWGTPETYCGRGMVL